MIVSFDRDAFQFYEDCHECIKTGFYGKYEYIKDVNMECPKCMDKYKIFDAQGLITVCNNLEKHEQVQKWISEHKEEADDMYRKLFGDLK